MTYAGMFSSQESAQPKLKESNQDFHEQFPLFSSFWLKDFQETETDQTFMACILCVEQ
jgi:hypothetical protein